MSEKELAERVARLETQVRVLTWALWLIAVAALAAYLVRLHRPAAAKGPPSSEAQAVLLSPEGAAPVPSAPEKPRPAPAGPAADTESLVFPGFPDASPASSR